MQERKPGVDVRCIMDGLDFSPIEIPHQICNPAANAKLAAKFLQSEPDQSCQEENEDGSSVCLMFNTFYPYIETTFMVVVPYEDSNSQVLDTLFNTT